MSFLTERALVRSIPATTTAAPRILSTTATRSFTTSFIHQKSATDAVKDGVKTVDRTVSDQIVKGLDAAAEARDKVKETTTSDATAKAQELKGQATGKAEELKGQARGAASEAASKAQGAAEKAKQKL